MPVFLMPTTTIVVSCPIQRTPRVQQVEGLFDLTPARQAEQRWEVALPLEARPWHIGLIVGPSGCGKSTIARRLWPSHLAFELSWPAVWALNERPCERSAISCISSGSGGTATGGPSGSGLGSVP